MNFHPQQPVSEQVQNFVSTVGSLRANDLPPVLDLEVPNEWSSIEMSQRIKLVTAWLDGVEKALKVRPIVYLSPNFIKNVLGTENAQVLRKYPLWIANYTTAPQPIVPLPWTSWTFWQHSDNGTVAGITCNVVDLDWYAGSLRSLKKLAVRKRASSRTLNKFASPVKRKRKTYARS